MSWVIQRVDTPASLRHSRREADLLWYGPSQILAAQIAEGDVGAIRTAVRQDATRRTGLITDLIVDESVRGQGVEQELISAAEKSLQKKGVTKLQALVRDGFQFTKYFLGAGYEPFRKTVVLQFTVPTQYTAPSGEFEITVAGEFNPPEIANFIFDSYQPYWQFWKETDGEKALGRVEYPVEESTDVLAQQKAANWGRVLGRLKKFDPAKQRWMIARKAGKIVGLCDVKADALDAMDWGVLVARDHGGKALGRALLTAALNWLREQGLKQVLVTTTSGLDDYDPTVYLYTVVGGAAIQGEYTVLRR